MKWATDGRMTESDRAASVGNSMTGGGPLGATTTLSFEVFRGTVQAVNIGPTAVLSLVILIANIILGVVYTRLTGRVSA